MPINTSEDNIKYYSDAIKAASDESEAEFGNWFNNSTNPTEDFNKGYKDFFCSILKPVVFEKTKDNSQNLTALEIGCGGGRIMNAACKYFGHVIGLDIHSDLDKTKVILGKYNSNFEVKPISQDMTFPVSDKSVDFVYSFIVFQHILKVDCFIKYAEEIKRILKDDGTAIIYYGRPRKWSQKLSQYAFVNFLRGIMDKIFFEKIKLDILGNGYREYPNAKVNCVNLVVTRKKARKIFRQNKFKILEEGVSKKRHTALGTQYYVVIKKHGSL
jgi:SAM-dependent methyltransferase